MEEKNELRAITTRVNAKLWEDIGIIAIKKGITRTEIIDTVLRQYREENKKG